MHEMRMMLIAGRLRQPGVMGVLAIERAKCTAGDAVAKNGPYGNFDIIWGLSSSTLPGTRHGLCSTSCPC